MKHQEFQQTWRALETLEEQRLQRERLSKRDRLIVWLLWIASGVALGFVAYTTFAVGTVQ